MPTSRKKFELSPRLKLGVGRGRNHIFKISAIACLLLALAMAGYAFHLILSNNGNDNKNAAQVLGASDVRTPAPQQPQLIQYKVVQGDTLFNVSQKYNISWTTLATLNNLKSPFTLKLGQILEIPQ